MFLSLPNSCSIRIEKNSSSLSASLIPFPKDFADCLMLSKQDKNSSTFLLFSCILFFKLLIKDYYKNSNYKKSWTKKCLGWISLNYSCHQQCPANSEPKLI